MPYPKHISEVDPDRKLSSRERRQIRNKISARNFRQRRKEHITTLEAEVAKLKEQVSKYKHDAEKAAAENEVLKKQLEAIKRLINSNNTVNAPAFTSSRMAVTGNMMTGRKVVGTSRLAATTTSTAPAAQSNYNTNNLIQVNSVFAIPEPTLQAWESDITGSRDCEGVETVQAKALITESNDAISHSSNSRTHRRSLPPLDPKTLLKWTEILSGNGRLNRNDGLAEVTTPTPPTAATTITYPTPPNNTTTKQLLVALRALYETQKLGNSTNPSMFSGVNINIPQEVILAKLVLVIMAVAAQSGQKLSIVF